MASISAAGSALHVTQGRRGRNATRERSRSEEHTSELQSRLHLVCRLLLEKKKTTRHKTYAPELGTREQLHTAEGGTLGKNRARCRNGPALATHGARHPQAPPGAEPDRDP